MGEGEGVVVLRWHRIGVTALAYILPAVVLSPYIHGYRHEPHACMVLLLSVAFIMYCCCRAKQESIAAAAAEAEAAERAQREAEEAAAAEAAAAAQALRELLDSKRARLPPEPSGAGSVQVVVRLPTGSRKGRRFLPSDPLQAVFDYVDVECAGAGAGEAQEQQGAAAGGEASGCGVKPGSYRLVTQFPRKVLTEDTTSSLQDAGISTDTALFIEPLS